MARVCLISLNAAGALLDESAAHIGGVERQTALLARWLSRRGHWVGVVVWADSSSQLDKLVDGVRLIRACPRHAGVRGLRFVHPRWTSLVRAMARADADVYYCNAAEAATGQIAMWCQLQGKRFVYSVASEPACEKSLPTLPHFYERVFYRYALRRADSIIVQNDVQKKKMASSFNRPATVLPMPCEPPPQDDSWRARTDDEWRVLWIGRIAPVKRLELYLDAANLCPELQFDVVGGGNVEDGYGEELTRRALDMDNVNFIGPVSYSETWAYMRRARVLVCTSAYEGFPNTFLEAMSCGRPIVSTFDPGSVLQDQGAGMAVEDAREIVDAILFLRSDKDAYESMSRSGREYFARNNAADVALPKFEVELIGRAGLAAGMDLD